MMSVHIRQYDWVHLVSDKFANDGVVRGAIGYVLEAYLDGTFEVEVLDPRSGETLALIVAHADDIVVAGGES